MIRTYTGGLRMLVGSCLLLWSCGNTRQATTAASAAKACDYAQAGKAVLTLQKQPATVLSGTLPQSLMTFKAQGEAAFFEAAKTHPATAALMTPAGCRQFQLSHSETMSPELMKRYPQLVSLKGTGANGADLRLDWDGTEMHGQLLEGGMHLILEPFNLPEGRMYLLLDKAAMPANGLRRGNAPVQNQISIEKVPAKPTATE